VAVSLFRPIARMLMPGMVKEGLGITRIVNRLKGMGFGYRTQTMFQDVHAFKGFLDKEYLFKGYDRSIFPSTDMYVETPLRRVKGYRAFGEADIFNVRTGESEKRMISMYYDKEKTLDELEEEFLDEKEKARYEPDEIVEGIVFKGIEHNKGFPY